MTERGLESGEHFIQCFDQVNQLGRHRIDGNTSMQAMRGNVGGFALDRLQRESATRRDPAENASRQGGENDERP